MLKRIKYKYTLCAQVIIVIIILVIILQIRYDAFVPEEIVKYILN